MSNRSYSQGRRAPLLQKNHTRYLSPEIRVEDLSFTPKTPPAKHRAVSEAQASVITTYASLPRAPRRISLISASQQPGTTPNLARIKVQTAKNESRKIEQRGPVKDRTSEGRSNPGRGPSTKSREGELPWRSLHIHDTLHMPSRSAPNPNPNPSKAQA